MTLAVINIPMWELHFTILIKIDSNNTYFRKIGNEVDV